MTAAATALLLGGPIVPTIVNASSINETVPTSINTNINSDFNIPMKHTLEVKGMDTIITIQDSDMYAYLQQQGIALSSSVLTRGTGVTKIVWHGQARYGNVDLYLSKTWLNNISHVSYAAIYAAMVAMVPSAAVAIAAISSVINGGNFTSGKIFKIRSFVYAGSSNQ
ncbi:hypothetical protein FC69_GL000183 [Latilactobacillus fuchuensis DSM 14340 = JCM 11249]|uniref:Uncharacterized protein n=2 Tax=Latilactobacillus fuchuensis TaxID=164393 RepID=A0A0R1S4K4_9LACO|nr:hypothetical protein FC69_GL000183 [Latilactobacillus fuchuensis DSM 14340 = JCM 11249]